jgi:mono/diheme cytochrome c family protein
MKTRVLAFASAAVLALGIVTTHAGGWAVITVEDLPEHFIAGQPTTLKFSVRQHGQRLLGGLNAGVSAASRSKVVEAAAKPGQPGYYSATLTLPAAGEWTVTIHSGFGPASQVTLRPIQATAPASEPVPASAVRRGEQLFIAKGCHSCHAHAQTGRQPIAPYGADLSDKRYSDVLLAKILSDPSILPQVEAFAMPNLNLKQSEIMALVAFINKSPTRP